MQKPQQKPLPAQYLQKLGVTAVGLLAPRNHLFCEKEAEVTLASCHEILELF